MHSRAIVPPLRPAARARLPTAGATCNGTRGPSAARRRRRLHSCQRNGRCRAPNRAPASASLSVLGNASTAAAASAQLVAHWRGLRELGYRSRLVVRARRYRLGAQQHAASSPTRVRCGRGRHTATRGGAAAVGPAPTSRRELASQRRHVRQVPHLAHIPLRVAPCVEGRHDHALSATCKAEPVAGGRAAGGDTHWLSTRGHRARAASALLFGCSRGLCTAGCSRAVREQLREEHSLLQLCM